MAKINSKLNNKLKKLLKTNANDLAIRPGYPKKIIDLFPYVEKDKLEAFLHDNSVEELTLSKNNDINNCIHDLKDAQDFTSFNDILEKNNIFLSKKILKNLKDNFSTEKQKVLMWYGDESNLIAKNFFAISNEAETIAFTKNIETLYLGAYFLSGDLKSGKRIYAPILCYPIKIKADKLQNTVTIVKTGEPFLNAKLAQFIVDEYGFMIDETKFTDEYNGDVIKFINFLNAQLSELILNFYKTDLDFTKLKLTRLSDTSNVPINIFYNAAVMLMEPKGNVIKKNIEEMLSLNVDDPFKMNVDLGWKHYYQNKQIENDNLIEINRPLNIYQKYAIQSALNNDTLIYGPPGTGKSEVISSIIANAIHHDKSVLISSEKQAALNVLNDRLGSLNKICLFIYNSGDKDKFYNCLKEMDDLLNNYTDVPSQVNSSNEYKALLSLIEIYQQIKDYNQLVDLKSLYKRVNFSDYTNFFCESNHNINVFSTIMNKLSLDEKTMLSFCKLVCQMYDNYKESFDILFNSKFNKYDANQLNVLTSIDNNFLRSEIFWYFMMECNEIKQKSGLLDKIKAKKFTISFNVDNILKLLLEISKNNNFQQLTKDDLMFMISLGKYQDLEALLMWKKFDEFLVKHEFSKYDWFYNVFNKYNNTKATLATKSSKDLLNHYIGQLINKFNMQKQEFKERIRKCLRTSTLQRKPDINKLIKQYYDVFKFLFPIWVLSPENVCSLIELKPGQFNYGIFDEASQMFVENAYPLVYRCETNIVAGDDNQMPPSNWFAKSFDDEDEEFNEEADTENEAAESLLEKAKSCGWAEFHLKNHYRSQHASLIGFSNKFIYDDNLEFSTRNGINQNAIYVYNVNGVWDENINDIEVKKVIQILKETANEYKDKKILIITFNKKQAERVIEAISQEFIRTEIYEKFQNGMICVRNLENVQGDEGDIVILSVSYGKNPLGHVNQHFGVLNRSNGYKYLNVAVTRAKEKMLVVKSLYASDITIINNESANKFKEFINYVDKINDNKLNDEDDELSTITHSYSSQLKEDIYNKLLQKVNKTEYELLNQYDVGKHKIDFAIQSRKTNMIKLGIEIDGFTKSSQTKDVLELLDRMNFLDNLGYRMLVITELEWLLHQDDIVNNILNLLD